MSDSVSRADLGDNELGLEITEGTIMENADRAIEVWTSLRGRGQ